MATTRKTTTSVKLSPVPAIVKAASGAPSKRAATRANRHAWAHVGVVMTVCMSAALNAYANSLHATVAWAGALLGALIPALVFVLARVAGMQWKASSRSLAKFTATIGLSLLLLSVYHCACSLALLTGSPFVCAIMMSVTIDGGLVACELDIVLS